MKKIKQFFYDNKTVLISLFCFSILVYGYAGLNSIINLDGIDDFIIKDKVSNYALYLSVGRWGWSLIGLFFDFYPSSFLCLILNSVLFSVSGVYIGKLLKINNKIYTILLSMILIAFPTNIIAYTYLPWQYSIGIGYFVSIYSVYRLSTYKSYKDGLTASLFIAFGISIYQTFLPLIIVLCIVSLIISLSDKCTVKEFFIKALKYLLFGLIGAVIYYIIVKISTFIFNVDMNTYQGANTMFNIDFESIKLSFVNTLKSCVNVDFGYFYSTTINTVLLIIIAIGFLLYIFKIDPRKMIIYSILVYMIILSPRILNFIKPYVIYHLITLLPYSVFFIGCLAIAIKGISVFKSEKIKRILNRIMIVILVISSFSMMINANKAFIMSKQATDAAFSYLNRLQTRIEMLDGYNKLPNPKKYYLYRECEGCGLSKFPLSDYAYVKLQGVTWTFLEINSDTIPAFNLLGENVVSAELSSKEYQEIYDIAKYRKKYPDNSSIFIYKDIVVVKMEF